MVAIIECDGCGRHFTTADPIGMLDAITGACPTCSGTFRRAPQPVDLVPANAQRS